MSILAYIIIIYILVTICILYIIQLMEKESLKRKQLDCVEELDSIEFIDGYGRCQYCNTLLHESIYTDHLKTHNKVLRK